MFLQKTKVMLYAIIGVFILLITGNPGSVTAQCVPNTLEAWLQINGGAWMNDSTATLSVGGTLVLGPGPNSGTWEWTGPNGFTASTRQITFTDIQVEQSGKYVATNTVESGECSSSLTYTITVTQECVPNILEAWLKINDGAWVADSIAILDTGGKLVLGPGPNNGTWEWTGPNGFIDSTREITFTDIQPDQSGEYVATNTVESGECSSSLTYTVCVTNALEAWMQINGGAWMEATSATLSAGGTLVLGPGPNSGTWEWSGPNGFTASTREVTFTNIQPDQSGDYVATNTVEGGGCSSSLTYTITVTQECIPNILEAWLQINDGEWVADSVATLDEGGKLVLGPGPNNGTWEWTGPNGFTASTREVTFTNIQPDQSGDYVATNTVESGECSSSLTYTVIVNPIPTAVEEEEVSLPQEFSLGQNYPNPFNPSTMITYSLPEATHMTLTIYNTSGQEVIQLVNAGQGAGEYTVQWNGKDSHGRLVASGIYIYKMKAGQFTDIKKMFFVK